MTNPEVLSAPLKDIELELPVASESACIPTAELVVAEASPLSRLGLFSPEEWNSIARQPQRFVKELGIYKKPRRRGKLILLTDFDEGEVSIFAENKRLSMDWLKLRETIISRDQMDEKYAVQYEVPPLGRRLFNRGRTLALGTLGITAGTGLQNNLIMATSLGDPRNLMTVGIATAITCVGGIWDSSRKRSQMGELVARFKKQYSLEGVQNAPDTSFTAIIPKALELRSYDKEHFKTIRNLLEETEQEEGQNTGSITAIDAGFAGKSCFMEVHSWITGHTHDKSLTTKEAMTIWDGGLKTVVADIAGYATLNREIQKLKIDRDNNTIQIKLLENEKDELLKRIFDGAIEVESHKARLKQQKEAGGIEVAIAGVVSSLKQLAETENPGSNVYSAGVVVAAMALASWCIAKGKDTDIYDDLEMILRHTREAQKLLFDRGDDENPVTIAPKKVIRIYYEEICQQLDVESFSGSLPPFATFEAMYEHYFDSGVPKYDVLIDGVSKEWRPDSSRK